VTAERPDGKTVRRRASETRSALTRGLTVPPPQAAHEAPEETAAAPAPSAERPAARTAPPTSKYTANLDADTAAEFDGLALTARRKLGRRVDKSDILKTLIHLAADDASLREQLIAELGAAEGRRDL
jgi:hypothetical protein